jgi:TonB family protein
MADTAQHLLGQVVDGRFPLRKLIGVSPDSAVFLTEVTEERSSEPATEAAIKLIPEERASSDEQLARWEAAAKLEHPGLLRILHFGRCTLDDSPCLFVVTELASENLSELLPKRPLTPDEAAAMMAPVLAALAFLHENDLVHAGLKPSNILAIDDQIKLSPDRILPASGSASSRPLAAPYAPPEALWFPASDVWSLGVTLYEALTQYLPNRDSSGRYVLPQLPSPFSEIIRGALVDDRAGRLTVDDIRSLLDPSFVPKPTPAVSRQPAEESVSESVPEAVPQALAAAAHAASSTVPLRAPEPPSSPKIDPLAVPLSQLPPKAAASAQPPARIPVSSLPNVNVTIAAPRRAAGPRAERGSFKYFLIGAGATLALAALLVPRMLRNGGNSAEPAARHSEETPATANPPVAPATSAPPAADSPAPKISSDAPAPAAAAPAGGTETAPAASERAPLSAAAATGAPKVIHRVIPEVSDKARSTIRGTVHINVRVAINADGTVSSADLDSPAVSQYFANLALKAARQWQFAPASGPSAVLRFDFTNSATTATVAR